MEILGSNSQTVMIHPLEKLVADFRGRIRRLLALYGLCWTVGTTLAVVIFVGLADYIFRFEDRGIRILASASVLAVFAWAAYRYLYLSINAKLADVELARHIERRFPGMGDSLASAVEFLRQSEENPMAGSIAMRRAVVAKTAAETEPIDLEKAVDRRPVIRAAVSSLAVTLLALTLIAVNPMGSGIAVARLVNPLGNIMWPRVTHLVFRRQTDRVARGQAFEVEIVEADGNLPAEVFIHYRFEDADGAISEESERMHLLDEAKVARRDNVVRPFSYRITGGDDNSMSWINVRVLEPPMLESASITLIPPKYTGWPNDRTKDNIRALVGTRMTVAARATKPLKIVQLHLESGRHFAGRISSDGVSFTIPAEPQESVVIEESGTYWFQFTDMDGISGGNDDRWEIRAVLDNPPTVTIEEPEANVFTTPYATVPLRVLAKDDLALRSLILEFNRSDQSDQSSATLPLYQGSERLLSQSQGMGDSGRLGDIRVVTHDWELTGLGLSAGLQLTFRVAADDYVPQTGRSGERRLIIITPDELIDRLAGRQALILSELARVLQMQRNSRQQVADLEIQVQQVGKLSQIALDNLRGAELNQRQINNTLTSRREGVPMHIGGLLADLESNKVDSPDMVRQMENLLTRIDRLAEEHLPVIGHELIAAVKTVQVGLENAPAHAGAQTERDTEDTQRLLMALRGAGTHQDKIIIELEQMLGELARWDSFRQFHRDASQLLRDQEELNRRTTDLGRRTLAKSLNNLSPQESADLRVASRQQSELGRRMDCLQQDMTAAAQQRREDDPLSAETVGDATALARKLSTSGKMRSASIDIDRNRMGHAMATQQQIVEHLHEILGVLANHREHQLGRLARQLREAETDLSELVQKQDALRRPLEEATAQNLQAEQRRQLQQFGHQQQEIREEAERMARRLERLTARQSSQKAQKAAVQMRQACQAVGRGEATSALQQADLAKSSLRDAAQHLAERRRQAETELAMEQLERLQDSVQSLSDRQRRVFDETCRLDELRHTQGRLTRTQASILQSLSREQSILQSETSAFADDLLGAEVVSMALGDAAVEMTTAVTLLDRQETGPRTQKAEQRAQARLGALLEALKPDQSEQKDDASEDGQGGQVSGSKQVLQNLVELKLIKLMQEEINHRTESLESRFGQHPKLDENSLQAYDQLSAEQARLAELLLGLIPEDKSQNALEPTPQTPEESP